MRDVFIVSAVSSPVGRRDGYLRDWSAPELLGTLLNAVVDKINLDPTLIEDVINGTVSQIGEQGITLGRTGVLASKLPDHVPGTSVNRQCGSSLTALQFAHGMIASGNMEVVIASGCELISKYPIMSDVDGTISDGRLMGNPFEQYY
jgi:acetyl-CoA acetyltransferase